MSNATKCSIIYFVGDFLYYLILYYTCLTNSLTLDSGKSFTCFFNVKRCWIQNDFFRYVLFYGPLLAVLAFNFVTYILVSNKLTKERKRITPIMEDNPKHNYSIQSTFRYFLLVLVFCWIFALVNRFVFQQCHHH